MKPYSVSTLALAVTVLAASVHAHGQMTKPEPRPVSALYRANAGALKNAGDDELQWAPLENLSQRKQADFPQAATFDIMNGCRGMVYESGNTVTTLAAGAEFTVTYYIQAPHPGYMNLNIVKPKVSTAGGAIMYEKYVSILTIDDFAGSGGTFDLKATVPETVTGCGAAGDCALQMYWHSDVANQTYPTCADIIVSASDANSSSAAAASATASTEGSDADTGSIAASSTSSSTTSSGSTSASASTSTDVVTTPTPTSATTLTPTATKKCTAKTRRLREI